MIPSRSHGRIRTAAITISMDTMCIDLAARRGFEKINDDVSYRRRKIPTPCLFSTWTEVSQSETFYYYVERF